MQWYSAQLHSLNERDECFNATSCELTAPVCAWTWLDVQKKTADVSCDSCRQQISGKPSQNRQVAQLSQRDRAAGWVSYGQKWKTGTGRQYFTYFVNCRSILFDDLMICLTSARGRPLFTLSMTHDTSLPPKRPFPVRQTLVFYNSLSSTCCVFVI